MCPKSYMHLGYMAFSNKNIPQEETQNFKSFLKFAVPEGTFTVTSTKFVIQESLKYTYQCTGVKFPASVLEAIGFSLPVHGFCGILVTPVAKTSSPDSSASSSPENHGIN
jgi:hypothetical protein